MGEFGKWLLDERTELFAYLSAVALDAVFLVPAALRLWPMGKEAAALGPGGLQRRVGLLPLWRLQGGPPSPAAVGFLLFRAWPATVRTLFGRFLDLYGRFQTLTAGSPDCSPTSLSGRIP